MTKKIEIEQKEIEAPYELPEGWKWVRLGDCAKSISKGTTPKGGKDAYVEKGINYLRIENLMDNGFIDLTNIAYITKEQHEGFLKRSILEAGDLLISIAGTLGRVGFVQETDLPMNTNQAIAFVRLHKHLFDNMYLKYAIESPFVNSELIAKTKVTSIPNLTLEIVSNCLIPLPPTLAEQQRIVNRIEIMFAKLDEAKEKARNAADSFETRKATILHQAFTGSLTAKWRKENGISDESWEEKTIGELFSHTTGKALKKDNQNGTPHKYITTSNLYWGEFDFSEVRTMYFSDDELEKCTAKKGDLLLCNGGDVGRAAIWNFDYEICLQNHVSKLRKKTGNIEIRLFYYYFMLSKIKGNISGKGIGISSLSAKDLLAMKINLPTLPEQQEIVRILDTVLEKERAAKSAAEQVLEQIALLKKSILARAFRGEL